MWVWIKIFKQIVVKRFWSDFSRECRTIFLYFEMFTLVLKIFSLRNIVLQSADTCMLL